MAISKLDPQINATDIKVMNELKKRLVDSNDKIAKENGISVKNRLNQQAGRSTLTYLMKYLRELDIPEAEANYYDQLKSPGTQWAANMSFKAIRENGFFDENDFKDIIENQYKMIQELQGKLDDVEEALLALGYLKKDISKVIKKLDLSLDEAQLVKQALILLMK